MGSTSSVHQIARTRSQKILSHDSTQSVSVHFVSEIAAACMTTAMTWSDCLLPDRQDCRSVTCIPPVEKNWFLGKCATSVITRHPSLTISYVTSPRPDDTPIHYINQITVASITSVIKNRVTIQDLEHLFNLLSPYCGRTLRGCEKKPPKSPFLLRRVVAINSSDIQFNTNYAG